MLSLQIGDCFVGSRFWNDSKVQHLFAAFQVLTESISRRRGMLSTARAIRSYRWWNLHCCGAFARGSFCFFRLYHIFLPGAQNVLHCLTILIVLFVFTPFHLHIALTSTAATISTEADYEDQSVVSCLDSTPTANIPCDLVPLRRPRVRASTSLSGVSTH